MKTRNLLFQLTDLESHLNDFSSEKLTREEAFDLKISFQHFKKNLLEMVFLSKEKPNQTSIEKKSMIRVDTFENNYPEIDLEVYDAVIEHHKSYDNVLKELKIDSAMDKRDIILKGRSGNTETHTDIINLEVILSECMGEMALLRELISLFISNGLEFMGAAKIHLQNEDYEGLELAAHKIKTGLAMMRAHSLHNMIVQIQKGCELDQDPKHLDFLCKCFTEEFPKVKDALDTAYVKMTNN
ncbi:Hpt domain-containing protein [Zobellia sp.]|nr:Hpt domain-containing protein [Zobellia sp.]